MNKISNLLLGIILVVIGIIFGLNALDITDINVFFDGWWTLFIIVPCFIGLFKNEDKSGNLIGLIIGLCLFLGCQDILKFELIWKLMIPFIIVMIGLSLIFKDTINSKVKKEIKKLNKQEGKEYYATFGGQTLDFSNEDFDECELNAVFGFVKCDLREAKIDKDSIINASSIFGYTTILVPNNVNVKVTSTPIFGGVIDERKRKNKDSKITLYINATCMFGGVELNDKDPEVD